MLQHKEHHSIGELCDEFGVTARALRFYEDEELIAPERRGTQRLYTDRDRARLAWIQQNYLRTDTITNANAHLVGAHAALPLTKDLGSNELASADGFRFVVPVRSVHAAGNPKYFGRGKGVTYINYTSAGSIGFFGFVVPGTLRDSMVILDGLLKQHTSLRPTTLVTDSASYTVIWTFAAECCLELLRSVRLRQETRYAGGVAVSNGSLSSANSCSMRRTVPRCRSTSRPHPWFAASSISSSSRVRRARRRGAYLLVVTNLAHVR
jgi:hypothetical protein